MDSIRTQLNKLSNLEKAERLADIESLIWDTKMNPDRGIYGFVGIATETGDLDLLDTLIRVDQRPTPAEYNVVAEHDHARDTTYGFTAYGVELHWYVVAYNYLSGHPRMTPSQTAMYAAMGEHLEKLGYNSEMKTWTFDIITVGANQSRRQALMSDIAQLGLFL